MLQHVSVAKVYFDTPSVIKKSIKCIIVTFYPVCSRSCTQLNIVLSLCESVALCCVVWHLCLKTHPLSQSYRIPFWRQRQVYDNDNWRQVMLNNLLQRRSSSAPLASEQQHCEYWSWSSVDKINVQRAKLKHVCNLPVPARVSLRRWPTLFTWTGDSGFFRIICLSLLLRPLLAVKDFIRTSFCTTPWVAQENGPVVLINRKLNYEISQRIGVETGGREAVAFSLDSGKKRWKLRAKRRKTGKKWEEMFKQHKTEKLKKYLTRILQRHANW